MRRKKSEYIYFFFKSGITNTFIITHLSSTNGDWIGSPPKKKYNTIKWLILKNTEENKTAIFFSYMRYNKMIYKFLCDIFAGCCCCCRLCWRYRWIFVVELLQHDKCEYSYSFDRFHQMNSIFFLDFCDCISKTFSPCNFLFALIGKMRLTFIHIQ